MRTLGPRVGLIFLLLCFATVLRADTAVKVGSPAPPLTFRQVLQAPEGTSENWEKLKGQAVVLEFWATWCGGCVDNIEHLNELVQEFKSRPVVFISITDETDVDLVKRFMVRHPMRGWVAFDAEEGTFKRYGIEGRPRTVLVDRDGIVQAIANPRSVTSRVLDELVAGKALDLPEPQMGPALGHEPNAPTPLLQVLIRPAAPVEVSGTSPGGIIEKGGRYDAYGEPLSQILSEAYEVPESRVDAPEWCRQARYDLSVVTPQHEEALRWPLVRRAVEAAFRLQVHKETKETSVYVLSVPKGEQPKLRPAISEGQSSHMIPRKGQLEVMGASIKTLMHAAQFVLNAEVLDETGLKGRYDFALNWEGDKPPSIIAAVREQLGLELAVKQRMLEHLVVDSVEEAKTW